MLKITTLDNCWMDRAINMSVRYIDRLFEYRISYSNPDCPWEKKSLWK